jgi:hypothetical protein
LNTTRDGERIDREVSLLESLKDGRGGILRSGCRDIYVRSGQKVEVILMSW